MEGQLRAAFRERGGVLFALVAALLFALSYGVFYSLCNSPASDISIHAAWAAEGDFRDLSSFFHHGAHPMWHMLTALLLLTGAPLPVAAALVTALCKLLEFLLIHRLFRRYLRDCCSRVGIVLAALCCVLVSSLCVPWYNPTVYLGVGSPNTWHSPTQMIAMVWMLLCVPYTAHCFDRFRVLADRDGAGAVLPWKEPVLLCLLLLCSLAAKPTFMQTFLPAACLFFLAMGIRRPKNSRFFLQMVGCVLPAVALMVLQYMYYFGIIVPSQGDMVLEISARKLKNVLIATLLIQGFPLFALFTDRDGKKDTLFWLTVLTDGVGVLEYLILGENGRRAADGNFGWGMMGAALMLWAVMLPRFLRDFKLRWAKEKRLTVRYGVGGALLGWHLASGIYYLYYLLSTGNWL